MTSVNASHTNWTLSAQAQLEEVGFGMVWMHMHEHRHGARKSL